jgi:glycosyltransferase involved in cell wall biosynthesis
MAIKNSERFLPEALAAIAAQTFTDYEIIIVDGHSSDRGPEIARNNPQTRCIPQNGRGFAHAWNVGIAASRGDFITFLDSDDLWTPGKLAAQLDVFDRQPATEYVYGRVAFFLDVGTSLPQGFRPDILSNSYLSHMTGCAMIRRETVARMGPFGLKLTIASDIEWFARLRDSTLSGVVDEVLLRKRLHRTNLSHTTSWQILKSELFRILKQRADGSRVAAPSLPDCTRANDARPVR